MKKNIYLQPECTCLGLKFRESLLSASFTLDAMTNDDTYAGGSYTFEE